MIDLTHRISTGMMVFPGDPSVHVREALTLEHDGVAVSELSLGSHTGTHLDAPSHTVVGGRTLDEITLDELVGEALIIHLAERDALENQQPIDASLIEQHLHKLGVTNSVPKHVLIHTGWDQYFNTERYLYHPYLTQDAALLLRNFGMKTLGVDTLNPDQTPTKTGGEPAEFVVHEVVLGEDGLIVENIAGLGQLGDYATIGFFPLRLGPVDGSPVRAVALEY